MTLCGWSISSTSSRGRCTEQYQPRQYKMTSEKEGGDRMSTCASEAGVQLGNHNLEGRPAAFLLGHACDSYEQQLSLHISWRKAGHHLQHLHQCSSSQRMHVLEGSSTYGSKLVLVYIHPGGLAGGFPSPCLLSNGSLVKLTDCCKSLKWIDTSMVQAWLTNLISC